MDELRQWRSAPRSAIAADAGTRRHEHARPVMRAWCYTATELRVQSCHERAEVGRMELATGPPVPAPRPVLDEVSAARTGPAVPPAARLGVELQRRDVVVVQRAPCVAVLADQAGGFQQRDLLPWPQLVERRRLRARQPEAVRLTIASDAEAAGRRSRKRQPDTHGRAPASMFFAPSRIMARTSSFHLTACASVMPRSRQSSFAGSVSRRPSACPPSAK
jgi:hypothetical protein